MKHLWLAVVIVLGYASLAHAQAAASNKLAWDQAAPDVATAQALTFTLYADSAVTGTKLTGVTCTGTVSPFLCSVAFPAFTPGAHTVTLTATNVAGESTKSPALAFTFVVIPTAPAGLRIQ